MIFPLDSPLSYASSEVATTFFLRPSSSSSFQSITQSLTSSQGYTLADFLYKPSSQDNNLESTVQPHNPNGI